MSEDLRHPDGVLVALRKITIRDLLRIGPQMNICRPPSDISNVNFFLDLSSPSGFFFTYT